jgi:phosphomevalonate kinase
MDELSESNKFVASSISVALSYIKGKTLNSLPDENDFELFLDNSFYSLHHPLTTFANFRPEQIAKTGLGSSAVVTVMVVASILKHSGVINPALVDNMTKVHVLAQLSNAIAQNKIGSGFDISASVFGSQVYTRFPPADLGPSLIDLMQNGPEGFAQRIDDLAHSANWKPPLTVQWNRNSCKFILIDFQRGSNTRILVPQVMAYLQNNENYARQFVNESTLTVDQMMSELARLGKNTKQDPSVLSRMREIGTRYLKLMRSLGNQAGVEVQPDLVVRLIEHFQRKLPGFIFGISPGAGGFDATSLLVEGKTSHTEIATCLDDISKKEGSHHFIN